MAIAVSPSTAEDVPANDDPRSDPMRHYTHYQDDAGTPNTALMERISAAVASGMGTVMFLIFSIIIIAGWITSGVLGLVSFDPYPFILLNLVFSAVAFFTGSLVIIAQKAQTRTDRANEESSAKHREELSQMHTQMLRENTTLTQEVHALSRSVHKLAAIMMKLIMQVFVATCRGQTVDPGLLKAAAAAVAALESEAGSDADPDTGNAGADPLPFPA